MSTYAIPQGTHHHSRSRSHSVPRQQQPIIYTSSHRSHGSHGSGGSHGSHRSRHSHGSHRSHGHHHSRPRRTSYSGEYDPSLRRHHSIGPGSRVIYPSAPTYHHNTTGSPAYFIPQTNATHGNVLHHQQPMQVVDPRRHRHNHSADPIAFGDTGHHHRHQFYPQDPGRRYVEPSLGERIRRFFHSFGRHSHSSSHPHSKGIGYADPHTGHPVDVRGRHIYRV